MSIRIPKPVDAAWEHLARRPLTTSAVAVFVASLAVALWRPWLPFLITAVAVAGWVGATIQRGRVAEVTDRYEKLLRQNGRLTEQLRRVERGDASALTAKIHTIPEAGDER